MKTVPWFWPPATAVLACAGAFGTQLGMDKDRFTINGTPRFLLGISYYGALGARPEFISKDLDDMQRLGFNWIRVWATWSAFGNDVSAVDAEGRGRQPYLNRLQWLVAECDRRGMVVDVTLSRGNGINGAPRLPTLAAHVQAVRTLTAALKPCRNWYFDLANERNIRDKRYVSIPELRKLRDTVKRLDPNRLVTASHAGGDMDRKALQAYIEDARLDFVAPHRPRNAKSPGQTERWTRQCLEWCRQIHGAVPVLYQEPFRRGFNPTRWEPPADAFLADLRAAVKGGAAGWCFHNGDQKNKPESEPRRSFDMRKKRLFDQLDPEERTVVAGLGTIVRAATSPHAAQRAAATGPLHVSKRDPRYFEDPAGKIVYLTGSHTWATLVERRMKDGPLFDYDQWLDFLVRHNHNFFRMWAWEHACWMQFAPRNVRILYHPNPYPRTGPGKALDGLPKFDVSRFDPEYFHRLRDRVEKAAQRGIYVGVMFFQGFSVEQKGTRGVDPRKGNPWDGHPFNRHNNINGIDGDPDGDGEGLEVHTLAIPAITELQKKYVRKVIDTVNDLDNVLWEIGNECHSGSVEWQYAMIRFVHQYEATKPKQHPVGMTGAPIRNDALFASPAEWVSPISHGGYRDDPPVADGTKVILADTDHLWGFGGSSTWVWKSFTRGLNPIFMDPYLDVRSTKRFGADTAYRYEPKWDPIRLAMGQTRTFALRMNLAAATPRTDLASTQYCLANPGIEYLVFQPEAGKAFTVQLPAGAYHMEWFDPAAGRTAVTGEITSAGGQQKFTPPFAGSSVLYLAGPRARR